jgi:hypothetical protein
VLCCRLIELSVTGNESSKWCCRSRSRKNTTMVTRDRHSWTVVG